jgi:FdhD protein
MTFIQEEPLAIRIQGNPYAVVMRTPGDDLAHAAGFCLTEGVVDDPDDIVNLAACDMDDTNVVTVALSDRRRKTIAGHLDRRGYISQTSCGLCGKTLVEELMQELPPLEEAVTIDPAAAEAALRGLDDLQPLRRRTRASHAAALYGADLQPLVVMEDVGRHNALDKAIGRLFLDRRLHLAKVAVLSSRISYELVQKSVRARIPILMALSRPTRLAVDLGARLGMSLAGAMRPEGLFLYCHPQRFVDADSGRLP